MNNYMTVADASKSSGFSVEHVRYLCREGTLTAIMPGRDWLIEPESLTAYLATDRRRGPKSDRRRRAALEARANEL